MKTDAWLKKAVLTDKGEEAEKWRETHQDALGVVDGHYATDGFRLHWVIGHDWPVGETWNNGRALAESISDAQTSAAVSTEHLVRACKMAHVINPQIVLSFADAEMQVGTTDVEVGDVLVPLAQGDEWPGHTPKGAYKPTFVTYRKTGPDVLVKINSKYLLDALSGMDKQTTIAVLAYERGYVLFLSSANENRALVMSLVNDDAKGPKLPQSKKEVKNADPTLLADGVPAGVSVLYAEV